MTIDTKATSNGGIRIEIDGRGEEMPPHIAGAFISRILFQMREQHKANPSGEALEGGAILHPSHISLSRNGRTGEAQINLLFGKVYLVIPMPPGTLKAAADSLKEIAAMPPAQRKN